MRKINLHNIILVFLVRVETHPASGTLIAGFEGATNISVLFCNIFSDNQQISTLWNTGNVANGIIQPLSQSLTSLVVTKDSLYENKLTILNLTSNLNDMIVFCGTEEDPKLANFTLRIYRKYLHRAVAILMTYILVYIMQVLLF